MANPQGQGSSLLCVFCTAPTTMVSTTAAAKYHYGTNKVTKEATKGAPSSSPNFKQGLKESAYNFYSLREHFIITFGCINKEDEGYQEKMKYM